MAEPLYLKYRPQTLAELVGQDILVTTLTNTIVHKKLAHAYLLTGPRGCGKTSTARIIAKSINCLEGMSATPCGKCQNCQEISGSISPDVIELDAASNRGVSDVETLIEKAYYPPINSPYKVFILDEVHMLSTQAFNALLKTIEEPPDNVIFIFATTEEHKVLPTIISRCQRFAIRPIEIGDIVSRLQYVITQEKININDAALEKIAYLSRGGMRDALSLLDQISVLSSEEQIIDLPLIEELFGTISDEVLSDLWQALLQSDYQATLGCLQSLEEGGKDGIQVIKNLLEYAVRQYQEMVVNAKSQNITADTLHQASYVVRGIFALEEGLRRSSKSNLRLRADILTLCMRYETGYGSMISVSAVQPPSAQPASSPKKNTIETKSQKNASQPLDPLRTAEKDNDQSKESDGQAFSPQDNISKKSLKTNEESSIFEKITSAPLRAQIKQHTFIIKQTADELELGLSPAKKEAFFTRINNKIPDLEKYMGCTVKITIAEPSGDNPQQIQYVSAKESAQEKQDMPSEVVQDLPATNQAQSKPKIPRDASPALTNAIQYLDGKIL